MLSALAQWGVANLFALGAVALLWRGFRVGRWRIDVLSFLFLWIFCILSWMMILGCAGQLHPAPVFGISLIGCLAMAWGWHRGTLFAGWGWRPVPWATLALLGLLLSPQLLKLAAHVWLLPPYVWDALVYHLPNVAEWIQSRQLVLFDTPAERSYWPANFALMQAWFVLFPGHDVLIELAGMPFYLLAVGSVYAIARALGMSRRWACSTAVIYGYTPAVSLLSVACTNDVAIGSLYLFVLALMIDGWREGGAFRRRLTLIALCFAVAVGTKPTILFLVPGLLVPWMLGVWNDRAGWLATAPLADGRRLPRLLRLWGLMACGGLLAGYWYLRNLVVFGNPFHPTDFYLFGKLVFGTGAGYGQQGTFSLASLTQNLSELFGTRIFDADGRFSAALTLMSGWGWFSFCCGWSTLLVGLAISKRLRWVAAAFCVSLVSLLAWVSPDPWNLRFALWFPALFVLSFGLVVSRLRHAPVRRAFCVLAALCVGLNFVGTLGSGRLGPDHWQAMAGLPVLERSTAALGYLIGPSYRRALETVPPEETLGYHLHGNGWIYPLYGADFSRRLRYVPIVPGGDVGDAMQRRGVRVLFVADPAPVIQREIAGAVASGSLRQIGAGLYVRR